MGLQPDQVPVDMRKQLYQKLGLTLPEEDSQSKAEKSGKKRKEAA